jgi:hypothetical protein
MYQRIKHLQVSSNAVLHCPQQQNISIATLEYRRPRRPNVPTRSMICTSMHLNYRPRDASWSRDVTTVLYANQHRDSEPGQHNDRDDHHDSDSAQTGAQCSLERRSHNVSLSLSGTHLGRIIRVHRKRPISQCTTYRPRVCVGSWDMSGWVVDRRQ